jgi:ATP-binding cassette subfamily C protein CydC
VAITGASGSGKSTLLALAAGVIQPTLGSVTVGSGPPQLGARTIGLLTQRTELLRDTVANNLRLAAPHADDAALWSALATVELADTVRALPRGLDCVLGEGGCGLSGGQARRLALARIVLLSPAVWLLDEPTAGMDDDLASRVMRNIAVAAGRATLLVACHHDRERVVAGRTVHMHMGTLDLGQSCTGEGRAL